MAQFPPAFHSPHSSRSSLSSTLSQSSIHTLAANVLATTASSSTSLLLAEGEVPVITEEGLRHVPYKLEARKYKSDPFRTSLLQVISGLKVYSWADTLITSRELQVQKVSGSLTNAVFFVSCPSVSAARTILLRIYGPSSGSLISRPRELHTLHVLSSQYRIGPRVFGTFENGRLEEYFDSTTLSASDLRDPEISRWIGIRMAELHSVDIAAIEENDQGEGKGWEIAVKKNIKSWLGPAQVVLDLPHVPDRYRKEMDLCLFRKQWEAYLHRLSQLEDAQDGSRRVFAHNDAQYGNLLRLKNPKEGTVKHRQIVVVDFEYASPNPASYDIANHFHEWTADYHSEEPHLLYPERYPTFEQRRNFYTAYMEQAVIAPITEERIRKLDSQVKLWSPASHAIWAIWALVQAREDVESNNPDPEFDYLGYARCRMQGFRREIHTLDLEL